MRNVYKQLKINTIISQYTERWIVTKLSNTTYLPNQNPPSWENKHVCTIATHWQ